MTLQDCIDIVEKMLENHGNIPDANCKMIYDRGYLTGLLAQMMMEDSRIRHEITKRAQHKKYGG